MKELVESQRKYAKEMDISYDVRFENLKKFKQMLKDNEDAIYQALYEDLGKDDKESFLTELSLLYIEINHHLVSLKKWMKPTKVRKSLGTINHNTYIYYVPKKTSLIIAPWNYPIHLIFMPLVGAISSGCTAILKPSEIAPNTAKLIEKIISNTFTEKYIAVVNGGAEVSTELLKYHYGQVFFTGSTRVGKIIAKACSETSTPITLELGGKSPVIVDETANFKKASRDIVWAKNINKGQTCIAPDFIICKESVKHLMVEELVKTIDALIAGDNKIINSDHEERIKNYYEDKAIINNAENEIILMDASLDDQVMKDEIFGNVLPIITYKNDEHLNEILEMYENSLALYIFTNDEKRYDEILNRHLFGGGCINSTFTHLLNHNAPFGGVNTSGHGNYHGFYSFKAFSHERTITKEQCDLNMNQRLFENEFLYKLVHKFLRLR